VLFYAICCTGRQGICKKKLTVKYSIAVPYDWFKGHSPRCKKVFVTLICKRCNSFDNNWSLDNQRRIIICKHYIHVTSLYCSGAILLDNFRLWGRKLFCGYQASKHKQHNTAITRKWKVQANSKIVCRGSYNGDTLTPLTILGRLAGISPEKGCIRHTHPSPQHANFTSDCNMQQTAYFYFICFWRPFRCRSFVQGCDKAMFECVSKMRAPPNSLRRNSVVMTPVFGRRAFSA